MADLTITDSSSMGDIRAMLSRTAEVETPAETKAPETKVETTEEETETASGTVEKPVAEKDDEEPELPKGVQKKIEKEAERAARAQAAIDKAVGERLAKEAEAAKLTEKPGSQPATKNSASENGKPTRPAAVPPFGKFDGTWEQHEAATLAYQTALDKYDTEHEAWLTAEIRRNTEREFTAKQQKDAAKVEWDAAIKEHGAEFPKLVDKIREVAPEGLQTAIGTLENWAAVAAHLGKNPKQLKELADLHQQNPYEAIARLGSIRAGLKSATTKAESEKPLPKPPAVPGGGASSTPGAFDYEGASMSQLKNRVKKIRAA